MKIEISPAVENVQIPFTVTADDGTVFSDAINLSKAQFEAMAPEDVQAIAADRHQAWADSINNPAKMDEAAIQGRIDLADAQIAVFMDMKADLGATLSDVKAANLGVQEAKGVL